MKKWNKIGFMFIALALLAAGCSGEEESSADGKVELVAWAWNVNVGALEDAIAIYQEEHPDVALKVEDIGRLDVYDKLATGLAAGGVGLPDIVLVEDDRIAGYLEAFPNEFANLSELGFDKHKEVFPDFKNELTSHNETSYAMPFDAGPVGMFYRRSVFNAAGVDVNAIQTWDDFLEAGTIIKEKTGVYAMPLDMYKDDPIFRMMLSQLGVFYYDEAGNIDLTNPKVVQAMEMLKQFGEAELLKDVDGWNGIVSATINGTVATIPFGVAYSGTIMDQAKDSAGDWGVFLMPAFEEGGNRAANIGGSSFMLVESSKKKQAAYDFMEFFTTDPEVQIIALEDYGLFPSLSTVYDTEAFTSDVQFFGEQKIWTLFAEEIKDVKMPYYTKDYSLGLNEAMKAQASMFNGEDPATALQNAAESLADRTARDINQY
ncbi:ABC transporter substrate-binding protein [Longirhabdus pacifica]|uniref:ABC transporter substrate-binding protein n=1 Tax=Longirhabdus pacifica TaxID=2305227 RepID=UPI00100909E7|nr:extracellular solute-binding protein [Longirhabdus pacifica]